MLLSIIMILGTVVVGFNGFDSTNFAKKLSGLFATKAEAAISAVKIAVPETIYLAPNFSAATAFQYFVNNKLDTGGNLELEVDNDCTTAKWYLYGSNVTDISVSISSGTAVMTSKSLATGGSTSSNLYSGSWDVSASGKGISLSTGIAQKGTGTVKWSFSYKINGVPANSYAYSTVYAPYCSPVGAASKSHVDITSAANTQHVSWWQGVHSFGEKPSGIHTKKEDDKLFNLSGGYSGRTKDFDSTHYISPMTDGVASSAAPTDVINYLTQNATNNADSSIYYGEFYTTKSLSSAAWLSVCATGYTAELSVDYSRYANLNTVPNVKAGTLVTKEQIGSTDTIKKMIILLV